MLAVVAHWEHARFGNLVKTIQASIFKCKSYSQHPAIGRKEGKIIVIKLIVHIKYVIVVTVMYIYVCI